MAQSRAPHYEFPMTPNLLRAFAILLALASPALADGRSDWTGYAWQQIALSQCTGDGNAVVCPLYHQKWDWKRDQWVDIAISLDLARGEMQLTQRLTDNDPNDDDDVCVTAIAVDAAGNNILAHHQNWHMSPRKPVEKSFRYRSPRLADIATIHIGSKQCRRGPTQDDALYASVLAGIHS